MKRRVLQLVILSSLLSAPVMAFEKEKVDTDGNVSLQLQIQSAPERYTFREYVADLTESTRIAQIDAGNPVRQLEARKNQKAQPLNPIVIRW